MGLMNAQSMLVWLGLGLGVTLLEDVKVIPLVGDDGDGGGLTSIPGVEGDGTFG